ncbi:MAG: YdcF family protein [Candidatus Wildermuthbacteria bacterium]|nr:YdcF family protein [Candidatus Wildermuthbacteria bacterium]
MKKQNPKSIVQDAFGEQGVQLFENILKQSPRPADAIVFLQGDQLDRAPATLALFQQGFAPLILISGNNVLVGPNTRPEENDFPLGLLKQYLVERGVPGSSILLDDQSMNTLGQAVNIVRIAKEKKWETFLVVVSPYHMIRAYLSLVKQVRDQRWEGKMAIYPVEFSWDSVPSGRKKTALEMLNVEMEKIKKYAKDIATIEQGLQYYKTG